MQESIVSGPVPEHLDQRLERRDTPPLPPQALVRFQLINRGVLPRPNYRWILYQDGRLFLARHSGDVTGDYLIPFDTELPKMPTKQLPGELVNQVKQKLQQTNFFQQPPYFLDLSVEDGGFYVVTAQMNGKHHEVIYEAAYTPLVEFLLTIE